MRNKKLSSIVAIFAAAIAVFSAANFARAADSSYAGLTISEIVYNPAGKNSDHAKWIELSNLSAKKIILYTTGNETTSGWKIKDIKLADPSNHYLYTQTNAPIEIDPGDLLIIADNLTNFDKDYPDLENVVIAKSAITLTTADSGGFYNLTLFDNTFSLDTIAYSKDWYPNTDDKGKSLEKIDLLGDNTKENWQESCEDGGTPGEEPKICETDPIPPSGNDRAINTPERTYSKNIKITELLPNPSADEDTGEFTELYNANSREIIELSGWKIEDKTGNSYPLPNISLQPGEYRAFYRNSSKFSLNNTGSEEIFLKNPDGEIVDQISYSGSVKENYSYALLDGSFSWTSSATPGENNVFAPPSIEASIEASMEDSSDNDDKTDTPKKVYLNEILPNPKDGSDGEYVEIVNGGNEPVDIAGWRLKDASKSKGYQLKEHIVLNPGEYLAVYRPDSKLALNNSDESVYLYDAKNEIISSVSFAKSIKNSSYNFDGKVWKWSKYLTPGKKNKFDSEPSVKIKKIKHAYKDLDTEFSAKAKDKETKKLKYAWDFGDGKKSTLAKTNHKYLATGKYTVTLSVTDDSQTVEKNFTLKVKKYPRPDLEIVKIIPNPAGNDSEGEIVEVKNNSGKKIDLASWKIATGSGEKMYNHPISDEISLGPNETKTITREFSKFSLNNKAGKVQLVMPDGKVADEVAYSKEKIADDEVYVKTNGEWQWIEPGTPDENTDEADTGDEESDSEKITGEDTSNDGEVLGATDENKTATANYNLNFSSEDAYVFLSRINFVPSSGQETNYCPISNPSSNIAYLIASLI